MTILSLYPELETDFELRVDEYNYPDPVERARLLDLARRLQETLRELEPKWKKLRQELVVLEDCFNPRQEDSEHQNGDPERIRLRYDVDLASKAFFQMDEKAQNMVTDLKRLEKPHVISRCNTDLLQGIFEHCVQDQPDSSRWFLQATTLSHVCYRWRTVALFTRILWVSIVVRLRSDQKAIQAFWKRSVERVKSRPGSICVTDLGDEEEIWTKLRELDFGQVPNVERFSWRVTTKDAARRLMEKAPTLNLPSRGAEVLDIESEFFRFMPFSVVSIDPSPLISRFHAFGTLREVCFDLFNFRNIPFDTVYKNVTRLWIRFSYDVRLNIMARAFPNVTQLRLDGTKAQRNHYASRVGFERMIRATWPNMTTLTFQAKDTFRSVATPNLPRDCEFPWSCLDMPKIRAISLPSQYNPGLNWSFLSKQTTLQFLDIAGGAGAYSDDKIYSRIAQTACQLRELAIVAEDSLLYMTPTDLPHLSHMILYDDELSVISLEIFDHIVYQRFLPEKYQVEGPSGEKDAIGVEALEEVREEKQIEAARLVLDVVESATSDSPKEDIGPRSKVDLSRATRTNPSLDILTLKTFDPKQSPPWFASRFIKCARETQSSVVRWERKYTSFYYAWN